MSQPFRRDLANTCHAAPSFGRASQHNPSCAVAAQLVPPHRGGYSGGGWCPPPDDEYDYCEDCAYTTVLLHQSALPDTKHYSAQCFMVVAQLQIHPTLRTHIPVKRKRSKCGIVIPSSLPPGLNAPPPPNPHPDNVVTIISTPAPADLRFNAATAKSKP